MMGAQEEHPVDIGVAVVGVPLVAVMDMAPGDLRVTAGEPGSSCHGRRGRGAG